MRILILLITCLTLSLFRIENFSVKKKNLFIDRVSSQNYNHHYNYLYFSVDAQQIKMHNDRAGSLQILTLDSVYTSSKAVYKTLDGRYTGVVLLDSSIYMTQSTTSIMTIDFDIIYFFGVQKSFLL